MFKISHPRGWASAREYMRAKKIFNRYAKKEGIVRLYHQNNSGLVMMEIKGEK